MDDNKGEYSATRDPVGKIISKVGMVDVVGLIRIVFTCAISK